MSALKIEESINNVLLFSVACYAKMQRQWTGGSGWRQRCSSEVYVTRGAVRRGGSKCGRTATGETAVTEYIVIVDGSAPPTAGAHRAMDRSSGTPPQSPSAAPSGFGAFCNAISETFSVRTVPHRTTSFGRRHRNVPIRWLVSSHL